MNSEYCGLNLGARFNLTQNQRCISKILLIATLLTFLPLIFSSYMPSRLVLAADIIVIPLLIGLMSWLIYSCKNGEERSQKGILEPDTARLRGRHPRMTYSPESQPSQREIPRSSFVPFSGRSYKLGDIL